MGIARAYALTDIELDLTRRRDQAGRYIFPDGGVARLRLYGSLTEDGLAAVRRRWEETS